MLATQKALLNFTFSFAVVLIFFTCVRRDVCVCVCYVVNRICLFPSVTHRNLDAEFSDALCYGVHDVGICLLQSGNGCLAVQCVEHDGAGLDALQCLEVWGDVLFACVVEVVAVVLPFHEHGLYDAVAAELLEATDLLLHVVVSLWLVHQVDVFGADGVEFEDVVVEVHQCFAYLGATYLCCVREDAHLGRRAVDVAHLLYPFDDFGEGGMQCRFAIAGKGQHVGCDAFGTQFL